MTDSPGSFELLSSRVDELEQRICALEHRERAIAAAVSTQLQPANQAEAEPSSMQAGTFFPTLGRAMLGIAGAYLLRAAAESAAMPKFAISAVATAYAFGWLIWAARDAALPSLTRYVYATTSVLIVVPLLWENTLHFHVFSPIVSAGILAAFATLSTALDLRCTSSRISWITLGAAAFTSAALAFATHQPLPFIFSLLVALLAIEGGRAFGSTQPARPLVALVADVAVWGLIFIYAGPETARTEYPLSPVLPLIAPACMLFLIEGTSVAVTAIAQKKTITLFEAMQSVLAFILAMWSVLVFVPSKSGVIAGTGCLALAFAAYTANYLRLRFLANRRNFQIFGVWAAGLLVTGTVLALPREFAATCLGIGALVAYWIATRRNSQMLRVQGGVYFMAAAVIAELPQYVFHAMAGAVPARADVSVLVVFVCSALVEIAARDSNQSSWRQTLLQLVPLLIATCTMCAALVQGSVFILGRGIPVGAHHLAFLRTLVLSGLSLCMALSGSRPSHALMKHLSYGALAFLAAKLLFEDLRHGHMEFVAASIFVFALTLIAVPRLIRTGRGIQGPNLAK
jgi:hypothetical protein